MSDVDASQLEGESYNNPDRDVLLGLGDVALYARTSQELAQCVARTLCDVMHADCVEVLELSGDADAIHLLASEGWATRCREWYSTRSSRGKLVNLVSHAPDPIVFTGHTLAGFDNEPPHLRREGVDSGVCVPIGAQESPFGMIGAYTKRQRSFRPGDATSMKFSSMVLAQFMKRCRAEQSSMRHVAMFESATDAVIGKSRSGVITHWNQAAERLYGYKAEEAIGKDIKLIVPSDKLAELREIFRRLNRGERIDSLETSRITRNGRRIDVVATISPILDSDETLLGALVVARERSADRTTAAGAGMRRDNHRIQVKAHRGAMARSNGDTMVRRILDCDPVGHAILAADHTITRVNDAFCAFLGRRPDELIGRRTYDFASPEGVQHEIDELSRLFKGDTESFSIEHEYARPNGDTVFGKLSVSLVQGGADGCVGLAVIEDLTRQRQSDERTNRMFRQLARMNRLAMLDRMSAGIAHELHQPLAAIANYTEGAIALIERHGDENSIREALDHVSSLTFRTSETIRKMRTFVRAAEPRRVNARLHEVISEVVDLVRPELTANSIQLSCSTVDELPPVMIDPVQIEQVVLNLLRNAIEAVIDQPVERAIQIASACDASTVELMMTDSGPGCDLDDLEQMFDSLYTSKPQGTGIGLSISRSIVEAHGGRLVAERHQPLGLKFTLRLPRVTSEQ